MTIKHYKIVFNSGVIPLNDIAELKNKMSSVFKIKGEKLDKLFSGGPVVIRSDVDYKTAMEYKGAFESVGATCQLIEVNDKSPKKKIIANRVRETDGYKKIICPNCGYEQKQSAECIRCEIIISKYRDKEYEESRMQEEIYQGKKSKIKSSDLKFTGVFSNTDSTVHKWILNRSIPQKLEYFFRNFSKRRVIRKNPFFKYIAKILDIAIQAIVLTSIVFILYVMFLYMSRMAWQIYIATPVGKQFLRISPVISRNIFVLLDKDLIHFSMQMTLVAFIVCLGISAICQVLHVARHLYLPRGFIGKIVLWGFPLTAIVAIRIQPIIGLDQFGLAYVLAILPTLCLFSGCFKFTQELLPEIGEVLRKALAFKNKFA